MRTPPILTYAFSDAGRPGSRASVEDQESAQVAYANKAEHSGELEKQKQSSQISFGHLSLTGKSLYPLSYVCTPSTTARAAKYCRNTTGAFDINSIG